MSAKLQPNQRMQSDGRAVTGLPGSQRSESGQGTCNGFPLSLRPQLMRRR